MFCNRYFTWDPVRRIGVVSYGIYLYHLMPYGITERRWGDWECTPLCSVRRAGARELVSWQR